MDEFEQVTFRFDGEMDVRYVSTRPEVGDLVAHDQEIWIVARVHTVEPGLVAVCRRTTGDDDDRRSGS